MPHGTSIAPLAIAVGLLAGGPAWASPKNPDHTEEIVVYQNTQSYFDILGWPDDNLGEEPIIHIHEYPARGEVKVDMVGESFIFYPDVDLCSANDEFVYSVVYADWMETYRIEVEIVCDAPTIIASFSPTGENGLERTFTVMGIQNFPKNSLSVFDRAGNPVFQQDEYQNTWDGRLPDGTYAKKEDEFLYVFDDGNGNLYSGYLKVN